jgi:hypothetical protein
MKECLDALIGRRCCKHGHIDRQQKHSGLHFPVANHADDERFVPRREGIRISRERRKKSAPKANQMSDDNTSSSNQASTEPMPANLSHPLKLSQFTWRHRLTHAVFIVAITFAFVSLRYFLDPKFPADRAAFTHDAFCVIIVFFWTLAPPAWFFFEFLFLWAGTTADDLKRVQDCQKLAQPFWAALLATLLLLIPKS